MPVPESSNRSRGFTGSGDKISDYGDQSSSYWPEGWNFERYRKSDQAEFLTLPEEDLAKFRAGLLDVLGMDGAVKLADLLAEDNARRQNPPGDISNARATAIDPPMLPNWLQTYTDRVVREEPWGYIAFKTCSYESPERWSEFRTKLDHVARLPFRRDANGQPSSAAAAADKHFRIHWIEDPALEGAGITRLQQELARRSPSLPGNLVRELFLLATPQSVAHLLGTEPFPEDPVRWRPDPPYILAVASRSNAIDEEDDPESERVEWFKEAFRVAAEVLVDEMWVALERLAWPVYRFTRNVRGVRLENGEERDGGTTDERKEGEGDERLDGIWWSTMPSPERMRRRRLWR